MKNKFKVFVLINDVFVLFKYEIIMFVTIHIYN